MRALIVVAIFAVACHKPGPRRFGNQLKAMGARIARAVKIDVKAKVDAKALVAPAPAPPPPAAQRVRDDEPPPAQPPRDQQPPPATTAPPMKIDRIDASRPTVFVLRGQSHDGKSFCETHTTQDACNSACTAMLRAHAFEKPGPSSPKGCSCNEQDRGC